MRAGVTLLAARLHGVGHRVLVVDPLQRTFEDPAEAAAAVAAFGGEVALQQHAVAAVAAVPAGAVVVGWARGSATAEHLACTRPVAGVVLVGGALPLAELGLLDWPTEVPAQVHAGTADPQRGPGDVEGLLADVRASGARARLVEHTGAGHLFDDPTLGGYDEVAAEALRDLVVDFCGRWAR